MLTKLNMHRRILKLIDLLSEEEISFYQSLGSAGTIFFYLSRKVVFKSDTNVIKAVGL